MHRGPGPSVESEGSAQRYAAREQMAGHELNRAQVGLAGAACIANFAHSRRARAIPRDNLPIEVRVTFPSIVQHRTIVQLRNHANITPPEARAEAMAPRGQYRLGVRKVSGYSPPLLPSNGAGSRPW